MGDFKRNCLKYFGTANVYDIFGLNAADSEAKIRKQFYKLSLEVHPDRVGKDMKEISTEKFKIINMIYSVLSDANKKKLYDETGVFDMGANVDFNSAMALKDYWKSLFPNVTVEAIDDFEKSYKGSKEEIEDLKQAYIRSKGDMNNILEYMLFGHPSEEPRYCTIIKSLINNGDVTGYKNFLNQSELQKLKRKRKYEKEAKECEIEKKKGNKKDESESGLDSLYKQITQRQENRAQSLFQHLEEKYAPKKKSNKKK